ncbi:MAG: PAS domain-containing protein [Cyanobacteriota bacterium]
MGDCEALQRRNDQLEAALTAITHDDADALLVGSSGPTGSSARLFLPERAHEPYRDIVEQMAHGVGILSADGRLLFVNPHLAALLDHPADQLRGRPLAEWIPASQRGCLEHLLRVSPGRSERAEIELQPIGGDPVPVLAVVNSLKGCADASHCLVLTDLSDLKLPGLPRAVEDHRDRLLAETVSAFLVETDGERQVAWVSTSVQSVLGWTPQNMLGSRLSSLLHPEDAIKADPSCWQPRSLVRLRTRAGIYRWMLACCWPHRGEGRLPSRWLLTFQDAGELVEEQRRGEINQDRLAEVLMATNGPQILLRPVRQPDGAITDFICTAANTAACRRYRLSSSALVGRRLQQALPGHVAVLLHALCQQALQSERPIASGELNECLGSTDEEHRSRIRVMRVGELLSCSWGGLDAAVLPPQEISSPLAVVSPMLVIEKVAQRHPPGHRQTRPLAVGLCHLRNIKEIHEHHGSSSVERILQVIASRLREMLQHDAILARINIDQLLIVFNGMNNQDHATVMAESIRAVIGLPLPIPDGSSRITASVAIRLQQPGEKKETLIREIMEDCASAADDSCN